MTIEQKTRKFATGKVDEVRDVVETKVEKVKERATDTWDKLEKVFEERVSRALGKLGVPGRDEMEALVSRVEELSKAVKKLNPQAATPAAKKAPAKAAAFVFLHQCTPRIRAAKAICSLDGFSSRPFMPLAAAESGNRLKAVFITTS